MSQVSPDGRYVMSTFAGSSSEDISNTYYVTNFKDYRFLQVFYPTRGILEWYDRNTGKRQPLPGADDPRYVQTDGVWSPDGKWIVFARARAVDPYPLGQKKAMRANDPNETQIQYDLYRVPFNDGRGGTPEPIAGASSNGMSNNFPKVSPDGRWIVFVQCRNGQLMRPDSQLYIVPFEGGAARRLRANTPHDEFVAQLLAQRPVAGLFVQGAFALYADVSHPHRCGRQLEPRHSYGQHDRLQPRGEHSRIRQHSRQTAWNRSRCPPWSSTA